MKKLKAIRSGALFAFVLVALAASAFGSVKAYQTFYPTSKTVVVEGDYIEASQPAPVEQGPEIGAIPGSDLPNPSCQGDECVWTLTGTFTDFVTTTIISFADPFQGLTTTGGTYIAASSTVSLFRAYITGAATTSLVMACGAAPTATALPTQRLITAAIGTSTTGIVENNVSSSVWAGYDGGAVPKVMLGPSLPYFNCAVATQVAALEAAVTQPGNTFDGRATIRVHRLRF